MAHQFGDKVRKTFTDFKEKSDTHAEDVLRSRELMHRRAFDDKDRDAEWRSKISEVLKRLV